MGTDILEGIAEVARQHLGWEGPLSGDMRLVEDLRLDSVRLLTLAAGVENRFRLALGEAEKGWAGGGAGCAARCGRGASGGGPAWRGFFRPASISSPLSPAPCPPAPCGRRSTRRYGSAACRSISRAPRACSRSPRRG